MALRFLRTLANRLTRRPAPPARRASAPPGWVEELDDGQRERLAHNLRRIVEPRRAVERELGAAR